MSHLVITLRKITKIPNSFHVFGQWGPCFLVPQDKQHITVIKVEVDIECKKGFTPINMKHGAISSDPNCTFKPMKTKRILWLFKIVNNHQ